MGLRLQCNIWRGARLYRRTQTAHSDVEKITKISRESYYLPVLRHDRQALAADLAGTETCHRRAAARPAGRHGNPPPAGPRPLRQRRVRSKGGTPSWRSGRRCSAVPQRVPRLLKPDDGHSTVLIGSFWLTSRAPRDAECQSWQGRAETESKLRRQVADAASPDDPRRGKTCIRHCDSFNFRILCVFFDAYGGLARCISLEGLHP